MIKHLSEPEVDSTKHINTNHDPSIPCEKMSLLEKFLIFFVISQLAKAAQVAPYKEYRLEALCGKSHEKQSLYLHNQAHLFTFNSTNKELLKCHLELHLHSDTFGFSLFTEVMKLEDTKDCTKDFLQFGR